VPAFSKIPWKVLAIDLYYLAIPSGRTITKAIFLPKERQGIWFLANKN